MKYNFDYRPNPKRRKLLFLPGWGHSINREFISYLAEYFEVLALTFPYSDPSLEADAPLGIDDYLSSLSSALEEQNFIPELAIGHSFGGKLLGFDQKIQAQKILIAPSIFRPRLRRRLRTKYRVFRNKLMKRIYLVLNRNLPSKYLGSKDYRQTDGKKRQTFIAIKDCYLTPRDLSSRMAWTIIGFKEDTEVDAKWLQKQCSSTSYTHFFLLPGNHNALYAEPDLLYEFLVKHDYC